MADSWTIWQRESAGQADGLMTTWRCLLVFAAIALIGVLWLGGATVAGGQVEPRESRTSPVSALDPCAELHALQRRGVDHGPEFWWAKGGCPTGHKTSP